jgi:hypothetical protein
LLLTAGCFDDPVEETLEITLGPAGSVEIAARTHIPAYHLDSGNPRLARRLRQLQQSLAEGWDSWPARFAAAGPWDEEISFHRQEGRLLDVERRATFLEPDAVERFFADRMSAAYAWDEESGRGELVFYPVAGGVGGRAERQQVEAALEPWSEAVADYAAATADLYRDLITRPDLARPAFQLLFDDVLPDAGDDEAAETALTPELAAHLDALATAMQRVFDVLLVPNDDAFSVNELSRRVFDPFPARLSVGVTAGGEVTEVEGFVAAGERWQVPGLDLWHAFTGLGAAWVTPDPATAYVEASRRGTDLDLDAWLARPRRVGDLPTADDVRAALDAALSPQPVYRLVWQRAAD